MTMTEQFAKLAELRGASEDASTGKPRSRSIPTDTKLGPYSILASRHNVPPFHGVEAEYPMWRNKLSSHRSPFNCREAVAPRAIPILGGDKDVMPSEVRRRHSARGIDEATNR